MKPIQPIKTPYAPTVVGHSSRWCNCECCPLHEHRTKVVLWRGQLPCDVLFIGEAPGVSEDATGQPFIGPSGKLLDKLLAEVFTRCRKFRFAITNTIACIPRDLENFDLADGKIRQPSKEEIAACRPRLLEFIDIAKPKRLVLVGKIASKLTYLERLKLPTLSIVHPAYMLRKGGASSLDYKRVVLTLAEWMKGKA